MSAPQSKSQSITEAQPFLRLTGVRKAYPGVVALAGFDLEVRPGEVIGLVGENGAGKSTLMKILGGVIAPDSGTIEVDGVPSQSFTVDRARSAPASPSCTRNSTSSTISTSPPMSSSAASRANTAFSTSSTPSGSVPPWRHSCAGSAPISARKTPVRKLSLAQQQIVEIAKALSCDARLVILDEPTSSLPLHETEKLLEVIAGSRPTASRSSSSRTACTRSSAPATGWSCCATASSSASSTAPRSPYQKLVRMMIGRELKVVYTPPSAPRGDVALSARDIRTAAYPQQPVSSICIAAKFSGLPVLSARAAANLPAPSSASIPIFGGTVAFDGRQFAIRTSGDAASRGIFLVPEDRKGAGILLDLSIAQNITLPNLRAYSRGGIVSAAAESKRGERSKADLDIRAPSVKVRTGALSGGNQQKVVLAKWLAMNPQVIIFDEPTRGIDVGAKFEIYRLMRGLADAGVAVLMISSDMEEVIGVSDRIAVMHEGRISGMLTRDQFSEENVLMLAVGRRGQQNGSERVNKKDLGLLVLILVVGLFVYLRNPLFLSANNLANTANLDRPVRPVLHRPGFCHHHRRHRALRRLDDRAARRAVRRYGRTPGRPLADRRGHRHAARHHAWGSPTAC